MILCGLWCSASKPTMNFFLKPLIESANKLYHNGMYFTVLMLYMYVSHITIGIEVCISSCKRIIKAAIVIMSCDLPARALVLNMRQFNGRNGCHLCEDTGATSDHNRLFRWWPYQTTSVLRTKESLINNGIYATTHDEIVNEQ